MNFFKRIALVIALLLVFVPSVAAQEATPEATPTEVNSFDMFWPIVAGRVMGEPLYPLKSLKESLRGKLIYSTYKQVDFNILLSEKRAVESEKLYLIKKDYKNGVKSLEASRVKLQKAKDLLPKVEAKGQNTTDLKNRIVVSVEKQTALYNFMLGKVEDSGAKQEISSARDTLVSLTSGLK